MQSDWLIPRTALHQRPRERHLHSPAPGMGLTKLKKEINIVTSKHKMESEGQAIQDPQRATGDK